MAILGQGERPGISARLELRQGPGLFITPQLRQAIKLLQCRASSGGLLWSGEIEDDNPLFAAACDAPRKAPTGRTGDGERASDVRDRTGSATPPPWRPRRRAPMDVFPERRRGGDELAPAGGYQAGGAGRLDKGTARRPSLTGWRGLRGGPFPRPRPAETLNEKLGDELPAPGRMATRGVLIDAVDAGGICDAISRGRRAPGWMKPGRAVLRPT